MNYKSISALLTTAAIALTLSTFNPLKSISQSTAERKITLLCAESINPPITFAYTQGDTILQPVFTWYSEYLLPTQSATELCQTVAQKLQAKYVQGQKFLLAYEQMKDKWRVCLVSKKDDKCSSTNSEELFSLNYDPKYNAPRCVMENREPTFTSCPSAPPPTRGQLFTSPGGKYTPTWWFFF